MSVEYLKKILTENSGIVCLLGRAQAIAGGCDFYREDYAYEIETKYGRSPGEIFSSSFFSASTSKREISAVLLTT